MDIIQDTREKEPWMLTSFADVATQTVETIDAGDYVILGRETLITIDRKKSPTELANNLGIHKDRFDRELGRMQQYTFRYIICEFPYEKLLMFPKGCGLPLRVQRKIRAKGKYLARRVKFLSEKYKVEFIFCTSREEAQEKAMELFREALESDDQRHTTEL